MSRGALAAAVEAAAAAVMDAAEAPEGTVAEEAPEAAGEPLSSEGAEAEVVAGETPPASEALTPAGEEGLAEPPMEYFGVDLSGLPADQRAEIITQWSERDRATNQAQREAAEARKAAEAAAQTPAAEAAPSVEAPEELTDDVLVQALGLDMEDQFDAHSAKTAVPLARLILELKDQVETLQTTTTTRDEQARWTGELDKLESTYGPLPVERTALLAKAVELNISDPEVAYWATVGPTRTELAREVEKRLAEQRAALAKGATTPRPKNTVDMVPGRLESKNTKDAVKEAAELAAKELGIDWGSAWSNR